MDRQTDGQITQTGRTKLINRTGYKCIYGRKTRTDGQTGWTDKRTNWMNGPDNLTNGLMNWKEGPCGRPNRLDERTEGQTNWRDRQTKQTGRMDQTDWMDGQMHQSHGLKGQKDRHADTWSGRMDR